MWKVDLGGCGYDPSEDEPPTDGRFSMSDTWDHEADAWDSLLAYDGDDLSDCGYANRPKKIIKCNKCGSTDVYWYQRENGTWCLYSKETKSVHVCEKVPEKILALKKKKDKLEAELSKIRIEIRDECTHPKQYWEKASCTDDYGHTDKYTRCSICGSTVNTRVTTSRTNTYNNVPKRKKPFEYTIDEQWENAKICPTCGDRAGFSFGTGDCGCGEE